MSSITRKMAQENMKKTEHTIFIRVGLSTFFLKVSQFVSILVHGLKNLL